MGSVVKTFVLICLLFFSLGTESIAGKPAPGEVILKRVVKGLQIQETEDGKIRVFNPQQVPDSIPKKEYRFPLEALNYQVAVREIYRDSQVGRYVWNISLDYKKSYIAAVYGSKDNQLDTTPEGNSLEISPSESFRSPVDFIIYGILDENNENYNRNKILLHRVNEVLPSVFRLITELHKNSILENFSDIAVQIKSIFDINGHLYFVINKRKTTELVLIEANKMGQIQNVIKYPNSIAESVHISPVSHQKYSIAILKKQYINFKKVRYSLLFVKKDLGQIKNLRPEGPVILAGKEISFIKVRSTSPLTGEDCANHPVQTYDIGDFKALRGVEPRTVVTHDAEGRYLIQFYKEYLSESTGQPIRDLHIRRVTADGEPDPDFNQDKLILSDLSIYLESSLLRDLPPQWNGQTVSLKDLAIRKVRRNLLKDIVSSGHKVTNHRIQASLAGIPIELREGVMDPPIQITRHSSKILLVTQNGKMLMYEQIRDDMASRSAGRILSAGRLDLLHPTFVSSPNGEKVIQAVFCDLTKNCKYLIVHTEQEKLFYTDNIENGVKPNLTWMELPLFTKGKISKILPWSNSSVVILSDKGEVFKLDISDLSKNGVAEYQHISFGENKIIQISGSEFSHALALDDRGRVFALGSGWRGQLGLGRDIVITNQPQLIRTLMDLKIIQVAVGECHSAVLTEQGEVYTFGCNNSSQLGLSSRWTHQWFPRKVEAFNGMKIVQLSAGGHSTGVITQEGRIIVFGSAKYFCALDSLQSGNLVRITDYMPEYKSKLNGKRVQSFQINGNSATFLSKDAVYICGAEPDSFQNHYLYEGLRKEFAFPTKLGYWNFWE